MDATSYEVIPIFLKMFFARLKLALAIAVFNVFVLFVRNVNSVQSLIHEFVKYAI